MQPQQIIQPFQPSGQQPMAYSQLPKKRSIGSLITIILLIFLLMGACAFGVWAFMSRQDFKDNSDKKSAVAVEQALADQKVVLDAEFFEKEKLPNETYTSPAQVGNVKIMYPKTWSAHVVEQESATTPVIGYFHPGFVPDTLSLNTTFALRVEIINNKYEDVLRTFDSFIASGAVSIKPYRAPLVKDVLGSRIDGKLNPGNDKVNGSMVVLPLRDKSIKIWTESTSYVNDFDNTVLANLSFVP